MSRLGHSSQHLGLTHFLSLGSGLGLGRKGLMHILFDTLLGLYYACSKAER